MAEYQEYFDKTEFLIEGSMSLAYRLHYEDKGVMDSRSWKCSNGGPFYTLGKVNDIPVYIRVGWYTIGSTVCCFYEPTGRMVDWDMIEEFLKKKAPKAEFTRIENLSRVSTHDYYKKKKDDNPVKKRMRK